MVTPRERYDFGCVWFRSIRLYQLLRAGSDAYSGAIFIWRSEWPRVRSSGWSWL